MPQRALQLFGEMQQQGLEPYVFTCTAVLNAGELTLQLFVRGSGRDASPISHFLRSGQENAVLGLHTDVITYRAVIRACRLCEMPERH